MRSSFIYIRNRIREHKKHDLLQACYNLLDKNKDEISPIWYVFLLMKWTYLHGEQKFPSKKLTHEKFHKILRFITTYNEEHISNFIKSGKIDRAFHIIGSQQLYLQLSVHKLKFATQLKLYSTLSSKYDINESFNKKTGLSIPEFIQILQVFWLYVNVDELKDSKLTFNGYLGDDFLELICEIFDTEKIRKFLRLLVLNPNHPIVDIQSSKRNIKKEELQSMERSFFTLFPFQLFNEKIKLVHKNIFNYSINHYIYDYLKSNDEKFTTEFGIRFEKYIECGLREIGNEYLTEVEVKKLLPKKSKLIDFWSKGDNIFIECKAIELPPYPSVNPTDDLLYNSIKDSIMKAYFKQLLHVANSLGNGNENYGIILTYKRFFWSHFIDLFELGDRKSDTKLDTNLLPPENVFIIDIYTWDSIINIIKSKQSTLLDILKLAKENNNKHDTKKQTFDMHLDDFILERIEISYLKEELNSLRLN